jgi:hypothetical protein
VVVVVMGNPLRTTWCGATQRGLSLCCLTYKDAVPRLQGSDCRGKAESNAHADAGGGGGGFAVGHWWVMGGQLASCVCEGQAGAKQGLSLRSSTQVR